MSMVKHTVTIFGESYTLVTDEPIALIDRAAQHLDELMATVARSTGKLDSKKVAVLAALQQEIHLQQIESRQRELVDLIDQVNR